MTDRKDRGSDPDEKASRTGDREIIDAAAREETPAFGGSSGGNIARDIGARDEVKEEAFGDETVTRVRGGDKPPEADRPEYNQK